MDSFIPALLQTVERSGDVVEFLKTNFKGTVVPADLSDDPPLSDMEDQQKKLSVNCELFETIINLVENASISARQADECVEFLIEKLDHIAEEEVEYLTDSIVKLVESPATHVPEGKSFALLPHLLHRLELQNSKLNLKSAKIKRLCSAAWPNSLTIRLISVLKDSHIDKSLFPLVAEKVVAQFEKTELLSEIPPIIHNYLSFSQRFGQKSALQDIAKYFFKCEKAQPGKFNEDQLTEIEGTVMLHINFSVNQNPQNGADFITAFKKGKVPLSPFTLGVLISLSKIKQISSKALNAVIQFASNYFRDKLLSESSAWYSELRSAFPLTRMSFEECLIKVIERTVNRWDHILPLLSHLGIQFLSSTPCKAPSVNELLEKSGRQILLSCFAQESMQNEILDQIFSFIITRSSQSSKFAALLTRFIKEFQQFFSEREAKLRELLDYLQYFTLETATTLVDAISPLFAKKSFQDHLVLVLRKSTFSKEIEARKIAVIGLTKFILTLEQLKGQTEADKDFENVQLDVLSSLRKCFSHQFEIRKILYERMLLLFSSVPSLRPFILDNISSQLMKNFDPEMVPPLHFKAMIDKNGTLVEPFGCLIKVAQGCLVIGQQEDSSRFQDHASFNNIKKQLQLLQQIVAATEPEELEVDKKTFSLESQSRAIVICDVAESSIEYLICSSSEPDTEKIFNVFTGFEKFLGCIKKENKRVFGCFTPFGLTKILSILVDGEEREREREKESGNDSGALQKPKQEQEQEELTLKQRLRSKPSLLMHILQEVQTMLQKNLDQFTEDELKDLTQLFLKEFYQFWKSSVSSGKKNSIFLAIENFEMIMSSLSRSKNSDDFVEFVSSIIDPVTEDTTPVGILDDITKQCLEIAYRVIANDAKLWKECELMLSVVKSLANHLPLAKKEACYSIIMSQFASISIPSVTLCRTIISDALLYSRSLSSIKLYLDLAKDAHSLMGDIQNENRDNAKTTFDIVNNASVINILTTLFALIDEFVIEELEWAFSYNLFASKQEERDLIYNRMDHLSELFCLFFKTSVDKNEAEAIMRLAIRFYKLLTTMTENIRWRMAEGGNSTNFCSPSYQSLVSNSGMTVTPAVFAFFDFINSEEMAQKKKKSSVQPNLIFEVEKYESALIQLASLSKVNLMHNFKKTQVRDFRIERSSLQEEQSGKKKKKLKIKESDDPVLRQDVFSSSSAKRRKTKHDSDE